MAEKAKGNVMVVPPQSSFRCALSFGTLDPAEAATLKSQIAAVMG